MRADVADETRTFLEANRTLRCLAKVKFRKESRRSPDVIAWAQSGAEKFSQVLLESLGYEPGCAVQMLMVSLSHQHRALLCFDLVLPDCDDEVRNRIDQSELEPIHFLFLKNGVYYLRRHRRLDSVVASRYRSKKRLDKGPRPYFSDLLNPPFYDNGVRLERGVNYDGPPLYDGNVDDEDDEDDEMIGGNGDDKNTNKEHEHKQDGVDKDNGTTQDENREKQDRDGTNTDLEKNASENEQNEVDKATNPNRDKNESKHTDGPEDDHGTDEERKISAEQASEMPVQGLQRTHRQKAEGTTERTEDGVRDAEPAAGTAGEAEVASAGKGAM